MLKGYKLSVTRGIRSEDQMYNVTIVDESIELKCSHTHNSKYAR